MPSVMRFAFGHNIQAEFSTVNIGGILSSVANTFRLGGCPSTAPTRVEAPAGNLHA